MLLKYWRRPVKTSVFRPLWVIFATCFQHRYSPLSGSAASFLTRSRAAFRLEAWPVVLGVLVCWLLRWKLHGLLWAPFETSHFGIVFSNVLAWDGCFHSEPEKSIEVWHFLFALWREMRSSLWILVIMSASCKGWLRSTVLISLGAVLSRSKCAHVRGVLYCGSVLFLHWILD